MKAFNLYTIVYTEVISAAHFFPNTYTLTLIYLLFALHSLNAEVSTIYQTPAKCTSCFTYLLEIQIIEYKHL